MADKLIVVKDSGACELATLKPYPDVAAGVNTTVSSSVSATGKVTWTVNASGGSDSYVTGITISPTGLVTLTRNNGLPNLTAQIQYPPITDTPVPGLGARMGSTTITTSGTNAVFDEYVSPMGGFNGSAGDASFNVPFTGWYVISNRATMLKTTANVPTATVRVVRNGSPLATLGINFGNNYFPFMAVNEQNEVEKSMIHLLNAGDLIAVESVNFAPGAEWIGDTFNIRWHSAP